MDARRAVEAVWRSEAPRLVAGLMRRVRDLGAAEELAQEALVAALEQWPAAGIPRNPGAWLMATAGHRAIDRLRRGRLIARKQSELAREIDEAKTATEPVEDNALRRSPGRARFACVRSAGRGAAGRSPGARRWP